MSRPTIYLERKIYMTSKGAMRASQIIFNAIVKFKVTYTNVGNSHPIYFYRYSFFTGKIVVMP